PLDDRTQETRNDSVRYRSHVVLGDLAGEADRDVDELAAEGLTREAADPFAEVEVGAELRELLSVQRGKIDGAADRSALEVFDHLACNDRRNALLCLLGRRTEVGCRD